MLFLTKGSDEVFAEFSTQHYECVITEKPLEPNTSRNTNTFQCFDFKHRLKEIRVTSKLFYEIITVGDTVEKVENTGIFIIKKKKLILKLTLIHTKSDKLDTLMVR